MSRDPRVDPRPGDVVMFGPQWQLERYAVLSVADGRVSYELGPLRPVLQATIREWRAWAKGGEVLHVAPERRESESEGGRDERD